MKFGLFTMMHPEVAVLSCLAISFVLFWCMGTDNPRGKLLAAGCCLVFNILGFFLLEPSYLTHKALLLQTILLITYGWQLYRTLDSDAETLLAAYLILAAVVVLDIIIGVIVGGFPSTAQTLGIYMKYRRAGFFYKLFKCFKGEVWLTSMLISEGWLALLVMWQLSIFVTQLKKPQSVQKKKTKI